MKYIYFLIFFLSTSLFAQFGHDGHFGQSPTGTAAAAWTPTDDPTLELWFRGDDFKATYSDSEVITTAWLDTSGRNNDATVSGNPYFISNALNGYGGVRFDGTGDYFSGTWTTSSNISIYIVHNAAPTGPGAVISTFDAGTAKGWVCRVSPTQNGVRWGDGVTTQVLDSNSATPYQVTSFVYTSASETGNVYYNGVLLGTDNEGLAYANSNFDIGKYAVYGQLLGDIIEILVFNKTHSDTERQQVEAYLTAKYFPAQNVDMDDLQLWYIADNISGSDASAITAPWPDKSYYFERDIDVNVGSPTIELNEVNGHKAVGFDGSTGDSFQLDGADTLSIPDQFSLFIVTLAKGTGLKGMVTHQNHLGASQGGFAFKYGHLGARILSSGNYMETSINADTTWKLLSFHGDNTAPHYEIFENGTKVLDNTTLAHDTNGYSPKLIIGKFYLDGGVLYSFEGFIAEILYYDTYLTTAERQAIETYLNARYSIY